MAVWNIRGVPEELARCVKSTAATRGVTLAGLVIETMAREVSSPAKKIANVSAGGVIDPELVELHREIGENAVRSIIAKSGVGVELTAHGLAEFAENNSGEIRGTPDLPRGGKAQELVDVVLKARSVGISTLAVEIMARGPKKIPAEDGADYFVGPRSPDEAADAMLEKSGELAKEIAARVAWRGSAGNPNITITREKFDGAKGRGKVGKGVRGVGRSPVTVAQGIDGPEGDSVGIGKPSVDMEALRDICAGKGMRPAPLSVEPIEVDLCGFKSYNETDGENYVCGKEKHGPKVNHGEWIKI